VTPLQAANSMATLARGGVYMNPRLFMDLPVSEKIPLNISQHTLDTVYDGMYAVVNERNGTAYGEFSPSLNLFKEQDLKIYGKTGSTENPEHAWFGGFATDSKGRKIAFALVVEGGQHGSRDAAPLANQLLQECIQAGFIGKLKLQNIN
jgi:peptidoglycan glycosyltransferase